MKITEIWFLPVLLAMIIFLAGVPFVFAAPAFDETTEEFNLDIDRAMDPPEPSDEATATVGGHQFDTLDKALTYAEEGETIVISGHFQEAIEITTANLSLEAAEAGARIDGGKEGHVIDIQAENVSINGVWIDNSGEDIRQEPAGVFVNASGATLSNLYLTEVSFGIWVNGVDSVTISENRIEGRDGVFPHVNRGNGIHLWRTADVTVHKNEITTVRDGIYYSWATNVTATDNAMWNNRYGVHYMYSSDNILRNNIAVDNDVGFALMVSERLEIVNNTAVRNAGTSGHGILIKDIDHSTVHGNTVIENRNGLYVYNSHHNKLTENLVLRNHVGIQSTAGSSNQEVHGNSFIDNDAEALATTNSILVWNGSDQGNYWSDARTIDLSNDGTSDVRHRPAGLVEHLIAEHPHVAIFANSPAFDAVRVAESSFPVVEAPGIVDYHPTVEPMHDDWKTYANYRN